MQRLSLSVDQDGMAATITGQSDEIRSVGHADEVIRATCEKAGVIHGLLDKEIAAAALSLFGHGRVSRTCVALGTAPVPDRAAHIGVIIEHYDATLFPDDMINGEIDEILYCEALEWITEPVIVKRGECAAEMVPSRPAVAGLNVLGHPVPGNEGAVIEIPSITSVEFGLERLGDSNKLIAAYDGIVVRQERSCFLLPVNTNGAFTLEISDDRLRAWLQLFPAGPGGKNPSLSAVQQALQQRSICYNVNEADIRDALASLPHTRMPVTEVLIAAGVAPQKGKDGWIAYFINLNFSCKPAFSRGDQADYHSLHLFENVAAQQPLLKINPPQPGIDGKDVCGRTIAAPKGRPARLQAGKNILKSPEDPAVWIAAIHGHVYISYDYISVEELLNIDTDVDFHTGNISFTGDVAVAGDVKSGFAVDAGGSVHVCGTVEDASITSGKHVVVDRGFVGQGKGVIKAGGDVVAGFVRGQTVRARESILVAGEVLDAQLLAGKAILVEGAKSWIIGGEMIAGTLIRAYKAGNPQSNPTRLCAGLSYVIEERINDAAKRVEELAKRRHALSLRLGQLDQREKNEGRPLKEISLQRAHLTVSRSELDEKIALIKTDLSRFANRLYDTAARIEISHTLYSNVIVQLAYAMYVVQGEKRACRFLVDGGSVCCKLR
ncbi:MAG: DUF342 domain-containing protein [Chitinivibrionales bacterium]|nr:DUF342 domain-containing protein [Chitinivibrionales bacterium]